MNPVIEEISKIGIVPVIALDDAKDAEPLAKALCDGGLPCAEVTFRTAAAEESIRIMASGFPDMLVGAGTVLTTEQAVEQGLEVVKFFPAEAAGGLKMIKAMSAPYTSVKFMPTGGINTENLIDYLNFGKIVACGGSWMVSKDMIAAGEFDKIRDMTRNAVEKMLGFELKHIGINGSDENDADNTAGTFEKLFGFEKKSGNSSVFAGSAVEVMKAPYLGKNGHIAIGTNYIDRAVYHMEKQGVVFDKATVSCDLNYRNKLWSKEKAGEEMGELCKYVDVCIANEEDAGDVFGIKSSGTDVTSGTVNHEGYKEVAKKLADRFGFKKVAITLRTSISANDNKWAAMLYDGSEYFFSKSYLMHIVDRVGGGDSFGGGLIYSCLEGFDSQKTIEFAVAASCLKHSVEGDFNMVSVDEVLKLAGGDASGRVQR